MSKVWGLLFLVVGILFCVFPSNINAEASFNAFAKLKATLQGESVFRSGWIRFDQVSFSDQSVRVTVNIQGAFSDGQYGIIVHQYGDLTDNDQGTTLGGHFIGGGSTSHGCPPNPVRHEGDLGNWNATGGVISGSQVIAFDNATVSLHAPHEIIGLGVALHLGPDSCSASDNGGNWGIMAMGTIGIMNIDNNEAHYDSMTTSTAVATLLPTTACPACSGTVWFTQTSVGVSVIAQVFGLGNTVRGLNIHWYGDLSGVGDEKVGLHYNPYGRMHALPPTMPRHMGDLGNIKDFSVSTSSSWYKYETANIPNVRAIIGRSIVVASAPDHGTGIGCTQEGNMGPAVTLGVIGVASPSTVAPALPSDVNPLPNWTNLNCTVPNNPDPHDDDGKLAGLIIGWVLAVFFFGACVGLIVYYYARLRGRAGYEDF